MKALNLFFALVLSFGVLSARDKDSKNVSIDEQRYGEMLKDPFSKRVLELIFHPGVNHGGYVFTEEEKNEFIWFKEQGDKVLPVLLEIFKREPNPKVGSEFDEWDAVVVKQVILHMVENLPEGDPSGFVDEVRGQLPGWSDHQVENHDMHTGFIREALDLLAREGDKADIPIIKAFLEDANRNNRRSAEESLAKLNERLDLESPRRSPGLLQEERVGKRTTTSQPAKRGENPPSSTSGRLMWPWVIAVLGALVALFLLFRRKSIISFPNL